MARIHELARDGLAKLGHHGELGAMGVPRKDLPHWDDIQILPAQFASRPLMDDAPVATELVIGPRANKSLTLKIPLFVSDMSFGALSQEAKIALAKGAELAGTGICSGEGGSLREEREANSRYFYELASAKFGWDMDLMEHVQAFHFKGGQGAKTGTGGHLPGAKVTAKIAETRGLSVGQDAISPPTFASPVTIDEFRKLSDEVRERSGGIPIGYKLSANHIEDDIDFALDAGADYIILDGRGGGTGAAPLLFRDHISVPTIPALARARAPRQKGRPRGHPDHHRRAAHAGRFHQGHGPWRGWRCALELRHSGDWLRRRADVQHQQLSCRHRNPKGRTAPAAGRGYRGEAARDLLRSVRSPDAGHGARLRP